MSELSINNKGENMWKLEIPTYAEWKVAVEKYQEQVQKFWQDFFKDTFKVKK